jgi:hypothetical protein
MIVNSSSPVEPIIAATLPAPATRTAGIAVVVLLHGLALLLLLQTDKLRLRPLPAPHMMLIETVQPRSEQPPQTVPILPRSMTPAPITLPPPSFSIRTEGQPPLFAAPPRQGFDLSIPKDAPRSIDQLFPPPADRQKQFMLDLDRDNAIANEKDPPIIDSDCVAVVPKNSDPTPTPGAFGVGSIPVLVCSPHATLKSLKKRNDLYSPH